MTRGWKRPHSGVADYSSTSRGIVMTDAVGQVKFGVCVRQGWRMDLVEIADPLQQEEAMTQVARDADKGGWDSI